MLNKLIGLLGLAGLAPGCADAAPSTAACSGPHARTTPPAGAIVVDATGAHPGSFRTAGEAVATLALLVDQQQPGAAYYPRQEGQGQGQEQTVFFMPGVYREQVLIPPLAGGLVLQGYTCDAASYAGNEATLTHALAQRDIPANVTGEARNDLTSTLRLKSDGGIRVYNLNVANTAGDVGQALAVNANATGVGFYGCNLTGYQDTLLADRGRQLYARTLVAGATDFVFGRYARAWFEACDVRTVGAGYITASGREAANSSAIYVFNKASVEGTSGVASTYLGRPWRTFARVVWQNSALGDVVRPEGWSAWDSTSSTADVVFQEFNNTGAGAATAERVAFSSQRTAAVKITDVLGEGYESEAWVDMDYM